MTIIDTATVSALLIVLSVAVLATVVTFGFAAWAYVASWPARPARVRRPVVAPGNSRFAH